MLKMCSLWLFYVACGYVGVRVILKKSVRAELCFLGFVIVHFLLVEGQKVLDGSSISSLVVFWRYHLPTLPFVLAAVALGITVVSGMVKSKYRTFVLAVFMVLIVGESARKLIKFERRWGRELSAMDAANAWAGDFIRTDWQGPARDPWRYYNVGYWPPFRPKVFDPGGFLAYRVGGSSPKAKENGVKDLIMEEIPDYALLPVGYCETYLKSYCEAGAVKVAEREFEGIRYALYKKPLGRVD